MQFKRALVEVLADKIKAKGFKNISAFAKKTGVSHAFLSEFMKDPKMDISTGKLQQLLDPLDLTLSEFFEEVEKKRPRNADRRHERSGTSGVLHHVAERREKTVVSAH